MVFRYIQVADMLVARVMQMNPADPDTEVDKFVNFCESEGRPSLGRIRSVTGQERIQKIHAGLRWLRALYLDFERQAAIRERGQ